MNDKPSYQQLEAMYEASQTRVKWLSHRVVELEADIIVLRADIKSLSTEAIRLRAADRVIRCHTDLLLYAQQQSERGVPCYVSGMRVLHSKTGAVLAEVK